MPERGRRHKMDKSIYRIETAKGTHEGTLTEVWAWQEEIQGAFASLVLPTGEIVDVRDCDSMGDVLAAIREEQGDAEPSSPCAKSS